MSNFRIIGLHHVQLAMPQGAEDTARAFHCGVLGLEEMPKPPELAGRGGVWFAGQGVAVHLGTQEPFLPATKAHPAFAVDDLTTAQEALRDQGAGDITSLPGLRRFYIADPFGNRIEILQTD